MKIAFDLDGTLVRESHPFPLENQVIYENLTSENMREGTVSIWQQLRAANHELWVYTFSYRQVDVIESLFQKYGLTIDGAVNYQIHEETLRTSQSNFTGYWKYPPLFGFDLLIDNMEEIAREGEVHGFEVLWLQENDPDWVQKVLDKVYLLGSK
ncbi:MAG TPA: hypothetical protein DCS93_40365 [Microscillaceae bacterium]|nr:hypothetical protein [Microscillaceae bacterium]